MTGVQTCALPIWEMLFIVRNVFREVSADQAVFDEMFVMRPPKRVVGGLSLYF